MGTKVGQAAQELARVNPWWRSRDWARTDPDLCAATESGLGYRSPCLDELKEGGLYLLRGPRRVGKTVALKQKISDLIAQGVAPTSIVRIAADAWSATDLRTVVQNTAIPPAPPEAPRWWLLDEVTATVGDWAAQIKWLRDNDSDFRKATVILTGSNASALTAASGVLAGRRGQVTDADRSLLPMGFRTFSRLLRPELLDVQPLPLNGLRGKPARDAYAALIPWLDNLVRLWETYVAYGGFPIAVTAVTGGEAIPSWFTTDIFNVIFRDAFGSSHLSQNTTCALVERLMESIATPANLSKIGSDLGLSFDIVARHVGYLHDAYLLWRCPQRADKSWTARERAQDKLYAVDPLIARLAHLQNPARRDIDLTALSEMQIGMALQRRVLAMGRSWAQDAFVFYERTPTRKEVDFVAEPLGDVAVEGKYTEGRWRTEAATVNASGYRGILATRNVLDTSDDQAWAVPAGILCYLIDT